MRYWDRAVTEKRSDNDLEAMVSLLSIDARGIYYVKQS